MNLIISSLYRCLVVWIKKRHLCHSCLPRCHSRESGNPAFLNKLYTKFLYNFPCFYYFLLDSRFRGNDIDTR